MPFGIGLHVLIALFFAVHVVRSGQQMYWLIILFSFPLLGSLVYFLGIYLPSSRVDRHARHAVASAARALNPMRELREAQAMFDRTPTAQGQMRMAKAYLEAGDPAQAARNYEDCLRGPFASDLEIRLGAARARFAGGHAAAALAHLDFIRETDPNFRAEEVSLLRAQALSGAGRFQEARAEFESAVARFGSFASRAEFGIWAATAGDLKLALCLQDQIQCAMQGWDRGTRRLNQPLLRRLDAAYKLVGQGGVNA